MAQHPYRILVVDDDEILRAGIRDLLEIAGYIVTTACDGVDALQHLSRMVRPPTLIISDIRMPNMDGFAFLEAVRDKPEFVSIPFIFLSARDGRENIWRGRLGGADDYITKPFEFQDLLVVIQAVLHRYEEVNLAQEARLETVRRRILQLLNHEFRTPLTYIVAYTDLMMGNLDLEESEELKQCVNGILEGSERLSNLIRNFLLLAELESGMGSKIYQHRKEKIADVKELVKGVMEGCRRRSDAQGVRVILKAPEKALPLMGDKTYLTSALDHLLDNAIRFSPKGKKSPVTITLKAQSDWIRIMIRDEGPGIPISVQKDLFDAFYQVNREKLEQGGGGAGLTIVKHVAELHGGHVRVDSCPGTGSTFELRLPQLKS